jgi:hypothetical protein
MIVLDEQLQGLGLKAVISHGIEASSESSRYCDQGQ